MISLEMLGKFPKIISRDEVLRLLKLSLEFGRGAKNIAITIRSVGDVEMRELNGQYRGRDSTTDVLSFAYDSDEKFAKIPELKEKFGEIIISIPQVRRQAKSIVRPFKQEFSLMVVHGMLHILGFDHATQKQEDAMFALQQEILFKAKLI